MHDPLQQQHPYGYQPGAPVEEAFGVAPMVEEEDGWGKIGIIMVSLALVFAGGVAYFIATSGGEDELAEAAAPAAADVAASDAQSEAVVPAAAHDAGGAAEPSAEELARQALVQADPAAGAGDAGSAAEASPGEASTGEAGAESTGLMRANGEVDRPTGLVSLSIESEPPGAAVIRKRDGVRLGTTPYLYETEAAAGSLSFVLSLDGYRSMSLSLPSDRDSVRQVMLLPGKGGAPIPAKAPEPVPEAKSDSAPDLVKTKTEAKSKPVPKAKPAPKSKAKPKPASKPKPRAKPKPKRSKKPKSGRVDYNPDAIPLD